MKDWAFVKLADLVDIKHGYAFKGEHFTDQQTDNILLTPGNFCIGGGFQLNKPKYYKGPIPKDYILKTGDLVVTMTDLSKQGDTLGFPALIPNDPQHIFLHNQRIGLVEKKTERVDMMYLYYLMRTKQYQKFVVGSASGATVHHTSPNKILSYITKMPNVSYQKQVSFILYALEKLINNNTQKTKVLADITQTIYIGWFVKLLNPRFKDAKFKSTPLKDICQYIGRGISPHYTEKQNTTVLNQKCIRNGRISLEESRYQDKPVSSEKLLRFGDVLINSTGVGTLGRVAQVYEKYLDTTVDSHVSIVRPNATINIDYFGFTLLNMSSYFSSQGKGATGQTELSRDAIENAVIPVPPLEMQEEFSKLITPIRSIINIIEKNNTELSDICSLLIPQLVTGKKEIMCK